MRFDLGKLDSGEQSLPLGLLVLKLVVVFFSPYPEIRGKDSRIFGVVSDLCPSESQQC